MHPGTLSTPLTELLGISLPILLAPMGDSAGGRLAAAVSDAGGLGLIGGGYADPHWLETEIHNAGNARVGVGFITFALDTQPLPDEIAAFGITGKGLKELFASHPPLPERIAVLERAA